jgi:amino acid transporter
MRENMNIEEDSGTTVLRHDSKYEPKGSFQTILFGKPLATADAGEQTIGKAIGLAVFSSDALSSVAYGPQEMLIILAAAGSTAFGISVPLALAICGLLVILTLSYEQTIHAYPGGGGAYIVSRDNLGELPAQIAAAALLTDYIMTVAVSVSSGVAQVISAFPNLTNLKVELGVAMVLLIMMINLRGVKESGYIFAVPTYFFLLSMFVTIGFGMFRYLTGSLGQVINPPMDILAEHEILQPITLFLILKAFASGTTALTGVEAISNGITAFKEPRSSNAGKTLILMSVILGVMMMGITFLANHIGATPSETETIISQLARTALGDRGIIYLIVIAATTVILVMAANTAFADFPRLGALVGKDGFLPRQLAWRGSRLVYSRGIVALAAIASFLIVIFQASVTKLIPLYAIGVFLSFTLSQAGMAHRWWKSGKLKPGEEVVERGSSVHHDNKWLFKMIVNGFGSVLTLIVMAVFAITKFTDGAYVVIILLPALVYIFFAIHRHYKGLANRLSMDTYVSPARIVRHRVILPIGGVHRGTLAALRYAKTLSDDITAIHVSVDEEESAKIQQKWEIWGDGTRLVILESPYRVFIEPLLKYIDEIDETRQPNDIITIVVPEFIPKNMAANALHTQTAMELRMALRFRKDIVITNVPYQVD